MGFPNGSLRPLFLMPYTTELSRIETVYGKRIRLRPKPFCFSSPVLPYLAGFSAFVIWVFKTQIGPPLLASFTAFQPWIRSAMAIRRFDHNFLGLSRTETASIGGNRQNESGSTLRQPAALPT